MKGVLGFWGWVVQAIFHVIECWSQIFIEAKNIVLARQIHACTKCFASTGYHNGPNAVINTSLVKHGNEFFCHLYCEGVHVIGATECKC